MSGNMNDPVGVGTQGNRHMVFLADLEYSGTRTKFLAWPVKASGI
jgi:hypothetical protein